MSQPGGQWQFGVDERRLNIWSDVAMELNAKSQRGQGAERCDDNSPAIHGWVSRQPNVKVPRGTAENLMAVRKHLSSLAGLWKIAGHESQP
jgi:hypothetical protein